MGAYNPGLSTCFEVASPAMTMPEWFFNLSSGAS